MLGEVGVVGVVGVVDVALGPIVVVIGIAFCVTLLATRYHLPESLSIQGKRSLNNLVLTLVSLCSKNPVTTIYANL